MRIGIDCRFWNETGVGRYVRNLVEQLQILDETNEYVLFFLSKDRSQFSVLSSQFSVVTADVRWHSVEEQLKLPGILYKENLDLMHFPYFSVPIFYNRPFVITIHDLIINHFPTGQATTLPLPLYKLKYLGYQFVLQEAAKRAKKIITVSNATKDEIVDHLKVPESRIVVTYEGVDERVFSMKYLVSGIDKKTKNTKYEIQNTKYFLYVGNAYPHKNLEFLLDGFRRVILEPIRLAQGDRISSGDPTCASPLASARRVSRSASSRMTSDVKLVLVGRDDFFYKRLKEKVASMGLGDSVLFLQNVDDEELGELYRHAVAVVLPSLMEGFGLPAVEAMAAKCLVVASDIPAFREICHDAAVYFDPQDSSAIARVMKKVLQNRQDFTQYIARGQKQLKQFSWKTMAEQTLGVYNSLK